MLEYFVFEGRIDPALPFIERSSCVLRSLVLTEYTLSSSSALIYLLRALPNLESLILDKRGSGVRDIIPIFCSDSPNVCPNLIFLALPWSESLDTHIFPSVLAMIRYRHPQRLRTLRLLSVHHYSNIPSQQRTLASEFPELDVVMLGGNQRTMFLAECWI
ncbi:hypothetical protein FB45DRAFT_1018566 [Roridomyces roridus]|uniref:Uncharacterized protein n=1 Tax=Roridomyces roridus TaxID=1738132 RepID=A0AAD7CKR5_9AGAR|nr:hypothetical protein FB45DRAFT_1018566 [Roridomyces roridus]